MYYGEDENTTDLSSYVRKPEADAHYLNVNGNDKMESNIDMNNNKITNLKEAEDRTDAVNYNQLLDLMTNLVIHKKRMDEIEQKIPS